MFRQVISETPMTSEIANGMFQNISGGSFNGDISFLASIRALVAPRIPEGDKLTIRFGSTNYSAEKVKSTNIKDMMQCIFDPDRVEDGLLFVHNLASYRQEDNAVCMAVVKSEFAAQNEGFVLVEKVTEFYRKAFDVVCYINAERKSTVVFVDSMDLRKLHYLQCAIVTFLPWYFCKDDGGVTVTQEEKDLIYSLREKTSEPYMEIIEKISQKYDFETARISQLLNGFETRFLKNELENDMERLVEKDRYIDNLSNQFAVAHRERTDICVRILGLEAKIAEGASEDSEIKRYFINNKQVWLGNMRGDSEMTFVAYGYMSYWDEHMAKKIMDNKTSYMYSNCADAPGRIRRDDMERLMSAIFIDQELKIKTCAAYRFNLNGSVCAMQDYTFPAFLRNYLPNPHIQGYGCMGTYESRINSLLVKHEYVVAIEQCIASAKSLNFGDSIVMGNFMRSISSQNCGKIIELPDGSEVTPREAIKWLHEQEGTTAPEDMNGEEWVPF